MKLLQNLFVLCMVFLPLFSCSPPAAEKAPAVDMAKAKIEIQAMEDAYAAGLKAGDAEAVMAYYSDDAVNMPSNEPEAVGKAAILSRLKASMEKDTSNSTEAFEVMQLMGSGDYLIEVGKSTTTFPSGKTTTGKYISIFEKRDGKYVCVRDIWNSDTKETPE